jgi:hypothetical protein
MAAAEEHAASGEMRAIAWWLFVVRDRLGGFFVAAVGRLLRILRVLRIL